MATLNAKNDSFIGLLLDLAGRARPADMTAMPHDEAVALLQEYVNAHPEKNLGFDGEALTEQAASMPVAAPAPAPAPYAPEPVPDVPSEMPAWGMEVGAGSPEAQPPLMEGVPDFGAAMQGTYPAPPQPPTPFSAPQGAVPEQAPSFETPVPAEPATFDTPNYGIPQPAPEYGTSPEAPYGGAAPQYPEAPQPTYGEPAPAYGEPAVPYGMPPQPPQPAYGEPAPEPFFSQDAPAAAGESQPFGEGDAGGYGAAQDSDFYELPSMPKDRSRSKIVLYVALGIVVLVIAAIVLLIVLQPSLFAGILPAGLLPGR